MSKSLQKQHFLHLRLYNKKRYGLSHLNTNHLIEEDLMHRLRHIHHILVLSMLLTIVLGFNITVMAATPANISGALQQWHRVTLTFNGPQTSENAARNPFTDYRLNVTFTHLDSGKSYHVSGFYAADGKAAQTGVASGDKWRVHFMPDRTGKWQYSASFRTGKNIAINDEPQAGQPTAFDGTSDTFTVKPSKKTAPDFRAKGQLRYAGGHHLRFAGTGERFLRLGLGSPENFLAYADFDGTSDTGGLIPDFLHTYSVHVTDWQPSDPTWQIDKGKGIIGALNYLAAQGINSLYFLTYTLDGGDGMDVWPWTSPDARKRFDVSKLDQWELVFSHMTRLGIELHLVTQEYENDQLLGGSSKLNVVRKLYYRELVARFAHHPALQWNIGEENNNTTAEKLKFAAYLRQLDPYDHPIAVHSFYNLMPTLSSGTPDVYYDDLLAAKSPHFEAVSLQGNAGSYNRWALDLRTRSRQAGRKWVIYGDEQGPAVNANMDNIGLIVRQGAWGNLMGGGAGVAWYFGYQGDFGDLQQEDFTITAPLWERTRHAFTFFREDVPFWSMMPDNELIGGGVQVLRQGRKVFAVFFPNGASGKPNSLDLGEIGDKTYTVSWFDPINGGDLQTGSVTQISGTGAQSIGLPPYESDREWAVLVRVLPAKNEKIETYPSILNPSQPLRDIKR